MEVVVGSAKEFSEYFFEQVLSYRYKVFVKTLGWQLNAQDGQEFDQFDRPDTLYVVSLDREGGINGCARLLPTTQPYLLGEVFPQLMDGLPPPCSPDVWELSRFAAMDIVTQSTSSFGQFSSHIALELLQEAIECARNKGAKRIITVSPIGVERLLRRAGFHTHRAGPPIVFDGCTIIACWIEISEVSLEYTAASSNKLLANWS